MNVAMMNVAMMKQLSEWKLSQTRTHEIPLSTVIQQLWESSNSSNYDSSDHQSSPSSRHADSLPHETNQVGYSEPDISRSTIHNELDFGNCEMSSSSQTDNRRVHEQYTYSVVLPLPTDGPVSPPLLDDDDDENPDHKLSQLFLYFHLTLTGPAIETRRGHVVRWGALAHKVKHIKPKMTRPPQAHHPTAAGKILGKRRGSIEVDAALPPKRRDAPMAYTSWKLIPVKKIMSKPSAPSTITAPPPLMFNREAPSTTVSAAAPTTIDDDIENPDHRLSLVERIEKIWPTTKVQQHQHH